MKRYLLIILTLFGCTQKAVKDGGFEGSITYEITEFNLKSSAWKAYEQIKPGSRQVGWFKSGSMLGKPNFLLEFEYFDRPNNIVYAKFPGTDTVMAIHADKPFGGEPILSITPVEGTDTVLGYICKRVRIRSKNMDFVYSYSPDIPVNPALFANSKYNNYSEMYKHVRGYFLMCKGVNNGAYTFAARAVAVNPGPVPDSIFPNISKYQIKWIN